MKSVALERESKNKDTYPCLKKYENKEGFYVVLFNCPKKGMVVASNREDILIGLCYQGEDSPSFTEDTFTLFNGIIELTNN